MAITVGVRFRDTGKVYDFDPRDLQLLPGDRVMVETARGPECGEVVRANHEDPMVSVDMLKPVLRRADDVDLRRAAERVEREREAMRVCQELIQTHGLDMKLVDAEYAYDNSKILFNFTAEGRVDFRNLVKDLAGRFHTRIELHQIGVRDEAKKLGGLGICGRPFCCSQFLSDFQPVSIKMAKEQGLSLNPTKISGSCGRLMCCLKYEQDTYEELWKLTPRVGAVVMTPEGRGVVVDSAVLTGKVKVRLDKAPESPAVDMMRDDIQVLRGKGGKPPVAEAATETPTEAAAAPAQEPVTAPAETSAEEKPAENATASDGAPRRHRSRGRRGNRGRGGNRNVEN